MNFLDILKKSNHLLLGKTPCFVLNPSVVLDKISKFKRLFDGEIAYSLKTNPDKNIVRLVKGSDCSFTVASLEELKKLKELIGDISRVIYLSPCMDEEELKEVLELGIKRVSLDSELQVKLVVKYSMDIDEVFLRVSTSSKISKETFSYPKNSFLGIPLDGSINYLKELGGCGFKIGIHNHLSSQNIDLDSWKENLDVLFEFVQEVKKESLCLDSVNLGGGYPIPISYDEGVISIEEIAKLVNEFQGKVRGVYSDIDFTFEPGRYIVAEAIALISKIRNIKNFEGKKVLIIDSSTYNSSMDSLIVGLRLPCYSFSDNEKCEYLVRGRSPCSLDIFSEVIIPKVEIEDHLVFLNAGAYTFASDFVSMKKPKLIVIS